MSDWQHDPRQPGGMFVCPPPARETLPITTLLDVGFGVVTVRRDGEVVWQKYQSNRRMRSVEREARRQPDARWTVTFEGALSGAVYERTGRDQWVLVERLEGFA